ncbi:MAG: IPT/TIG domain-containing protein [Dysgonamonadaceae bacterium]|jgi:hypothetical protein|nr:IPT/TIG domain-containing protein [Dysgonamonadaceae bacterium]
MKKMRLKIRNVIPGIIIASTCMLWNCSRDDSEEQDDQVGDVSISSVIPSKARANEEIKVVGSNFSKDVRNNKIIINNEEITPYEIISTNEADTLYAVVPSRLGSGTVEVSVKGKRFTSDIYFEYLKQMKFSNIIGCVWSISWGMADPAAPKFNGSIGACIGENGKILLAEQWQHCIREVNPVGGTISLFAGNYGSSGQVPGPLLSAKFDTPKGIISIGSNRWIVFSDRQVQIIRDGQVALLGKSRDTQEEHTYSGPLADVNFCNTSGAAYDETTNSVYFACRDIDAQTSMNLHYIQKLNLTDNTVEVVAGSVAGNDSQGTIDGDALTTGRVDNPSRMYVAHNGTLYFLQSSGNGKSCVRKLENGILSTLAGKPGTAGYADGTGNDASFNFICEGGEPGGGIVEDADGNLLIADPGNHAIRKMTPAGIVTTITAMEAGGPNKWNYKDDYDPAMGNQLGATQYVAHPMHIFKIETDAYGIVQYTGDAPGIRKIVFE